MERSIVENYWGLKVKGGGYMPKVGRYLMALMLGSFLAPSIPAKDAGDLPKEVYRHWIHSREEDQGGIQVYRPEGFEFPPSRGRAGFEIKKGGVFIDHPIAPADGNESISGQWETIGPKKIRVTFPQHPERQSFVLEIVACDGKVLKVKRLESK
jgi:hypothetical protein